jgi:hypothetical protein
LSILLIKKNVFNATFSNVSVISCRPVLVVANTAWIRARLCKLQKWCTRFAAASDKAYQLFAHARWFSPVTPASSTTKTGRHDITETLLKVALKTFFLINKIDKIKT